MGRFLKKNTLEDDRPLLQATSMPAINAAGWQLPPESLFSRCYGAAQQ
jgi:hypothetical protein